VTSEWLASGSQLAAGVATFGGGWLAWSLIEYAIHGWLSHRLSTFVARLHAAHHRNPARVFTSPLAALPVAALLFAAAAAGFGGALAACFVAGVLAGFVRYERAHWRIHFRLPRNPRERRLRAHHLAHHFANPRAYWGVTTRFWDRVFGSLPSTWRDDYARCENAEPIRGPSNLRAVWNPRRVLGEVRASRNR